MRLRNYGAAIEADLQREYRVDFADWHRGALSSRRVLVLLEGLSEDSRYRTGFERAGNWPEWQQMLKHATNEVSLHRSGLYAGGDNAYAPTVYLDPLERVERQQEDTAETVFHQESEQELYGALGWS